ncbi:MAG: SEL1-like repeat protein [Acidobacteria bacterium]|nr:SEL1-like repeat protein [Acidobacteriota bacterium]
MAATIALQPALAGQLPPGLRASAERGDAVAQNELGSRYYAGRGVERDDAEAARWIQLAADQGYAPAQYNLGLLHFRNRGVARSAAAAARRYRAAAEQGYAPAQAGLGYLHIYGAGVLHVDRAGLAGRRQRLHETALRRAARRAGRADDRRRRDREPPACRRVATGPGPLTRRAVAQPASRAWTTRAARGSDGRPAHASAATHYDALETRDSRVISMTSRQEVDMKIRHARVLFSLFLVLGFATLALAQTETIDPTRFEEAIEAFEAEDRAMMPPAGAIVVTGSSSIRRWHPTLKQDLAPLTVIPRGFGGSTMQDVEHYLDRIVLPYEPRAVVIYEGDNDTGRFGVPPAEIAGRLEAIVERIHAVLPSTRVYVMSVKPSLARVAVWDTSTGVWPPTTTWCPTSTSPRPFSARTAR